jgi:hypothetical protein
VSGTQIARDGDFENAVTELSFSRDGRWLAATLSGGQGLRVIDATSWREAAADRGYGGDSYGAKFALCTVARDGKLRRYGPAPAFKLEATVETQGSPSRPAKAGIQRGARRWRRACAWREQ